MLDSILRMLHPTIPFITEEIWQSMNEENAKRSIMKSSFPSSNDWSADEAGARKSEWLKDFVSSVRQIRSEMNIPPKQSISIIIQMDEMKYDMCGASTTIGLMKMVTELNLPINAVFVVPACENVPSSTATLPGDVVTSMSGTTIRPTG